MQICIFEDTRSNNFTPLTLTRPVYDLRCGNYTLLERTQLFFPSQRLLLHCKPHLADCILEDHPYASVNNFPRHDTLFINGRVLADQKFKLNVGRFSKRERAFLLGDDVVAAYIAAPHIERVTSGWNRSPVDVSCFKNFPSEQIETHLVKFPWDLIHR